MVLTTQHCAWVLLVSRSLTPLDERIDRSSMDLSTFPQALYFVVMYYLSMSMLCCFLLLLCCILDAITVLLHHAISFKALVCWLVGFTHYGVTSLASATHYPYIASVINASPYGAELHLVMLTMCLLYICVNLGWCRNLLTVEYFWFWFSGILLCLKRCILSYKPSHRATKQQAVPTWAQPD